MIVINVSSSKPVANMIAPLMMSILKKEFIYGVSFVSSGSKYREQTSFIKQQKNATAKYFTVSVASKNTNEPIAVPAAAATHCTPESEATSDIEKGETVPVTKGFISKKPKMNDRTVFITGLNCSFGCFSSDFTLIKFFTLVFNIIFFSLLFNGCLYFITQGRKNRSKEEEGLKEHLRNFENKQRFILFFVPDI